MLRPPEMAIADGATATLAERRQEVLAGLTATDKRLSPTYLYDERGSQLFDEICTLPEYYATRTELTLLREHAGELSALVGPRAEVVELGAGSSLKARLLLGALDEPASYQPVDISAEYLAEQAAEIAAAYPNVAVQPVSADFTRPFLLPRQPARERALVFFPGSTIGNLSRTRSAALLASLAERVGGALLLGVDLCHDPDVLHAAYNDSRGVTAAFNLNLLARLNRELDADFDLEGFEHAAVYDRERARIEMRLVSRRAQLVTVAGVSVPFRAGEHIVSEHSHKYAPQELASMARDAGWRLASSWSDDDERFGVYFFRAS
ncbi:MAG TPA: L-histidine N(alpha)-methyltransferase [Gammaproteobacteria bacterium]